MSERIVSDPSQHGWIEVNGKWVWDASGGSIQDGDTEGQITTWSGAEWTPDSALTIDASGDATFSGDLKLATAFNTSLIKAKEVINANHLVLSSNNNAEHLVIDSSGNATFSGAVTSPLMARLQLTHRPRRYQRSHSIQGWLWLVV